MLVPVPRRRLLLLAPVALLAACETVDPTRPPPGSTTRRPTCESRFRACAPPVHYDETSDAARLELRRQVHVSLRMDVPERLARESATRVLRHAQSADVPALITLASIHEDEWAVLEKCQCPGEQNEWDKQGVGAVLAKRLPPAELRSPGTWENRMVARLATMRDLQHKIAMRGLSGGGAEDLEAARRTADLELCEAVHGARTFLLPDVYRDTVEAVRQRRANEAGSASADFAAAAIRRHEQSKTCAPADEPAAAPRGAAPAPAPGRADEPDEEQ